MTSSQQHEQLPSACSGPNNPRTKDLRNSLRSFGSHPVSQPFSPASGSALSDSGLNQVIHLSRIVESISCSAVIEERNRLAREIHDTLVQEFAGILLHLEAANGSELALNASECLARARELAKSGLEDARRMLLGLRPKSLEGADLSDALVQLAERFSRDFGINCRFNATGRPHELGDEVEDELYRVVQEALCNVRKHSRAGFVSILLTYTAAGVVLVIKDNGLGFTMRQPKPGARGFGLPAMCERASRLGGRMDINSGQGTGTEIRMSVPLSGNLQRKGTTNEIKFNNDGGPDQSPSSGGG